MTSTLLLIIGWAAIAVLALGATWSQNVAYFVGASDLPGVLRAFWTFVMETRANPASRSITVDLLFLMMSCVIFMVLEARRLAVRYVWAYVVFGALIAISVTFPLFMIARQLRIAAGHGKPAHPPRATVIDMVGLLATATLLVCLSGYVLRL